MASWLATTVVVWLVTTIGAISLPELARYRERGADSDLTQIQDADAYRVYVGGPQ